VALTYGAAIGHAARMGWKVQRLDPERSRRRLQVLAEFAGAKAARERTQPRRLQGERIRELIATRRRLAN